MPQSKNPFFHSQTRRKSESAVIPIRDRNAKRNTAIGPTARNPFAPPVPPKDKPPKIASAEPMIDKAKKTLDTLEKDWMLNDCLGSMPTPISEGGLAQEYIPNNIDAKCRSESQESVYDSAVDVIGALHSSDGMLQDTETGVKARATKRDTVADLLNDIMGSDKEVSRKHQDVLEAAAASRAMPLPLRIPNKLATSTRGSSVPLASKFNKLELGTRPSLKIATTFTDPRIAPIPLDLRRSDTQHMSHAHGRKDTTVRTSITDWTKRFYRGAERAQQRDMIPSTFLRTSARGTLDIQKPQEKAQQPLIKQRRSNTFPEHKSFYRLRNVINTHPAPTPPQRGNTQAITVNRMRDPDEAFNELLALRKRATADFNDVTTTTTTPNRDNKKLAGVAKGECSGLYTTAKSHVDDIMENVKNVGQKNRAKKRREKMMGEVRRKYEEMVSVSSSAKRGDGEYE